jgi:hypothetical protein
MICDANERSKCQSRRGCPAEPVIEIQPAPRITAVFRRPDDTVCHARCGRPLSLQGVRGVLEADFYCLSCLTHVTLPLAILETLPVVADEAAEPSLAAL